MRNSKVPALDINHRILLFQIFHPCITDHLSVKLSPILSSIWDNPWNACRRHTMSPRVDPLCRQLVKGSYVTIVKHFPTKRDIADTPSPTKDNT